MGLLPLTTAPSTAQAASTDGDVIVGDGAAGAYRWTSGGGAQPLGPYPYPVLESHATDVSADGAAVVGYYRTSGNDILAFHWTSGGGIADLPGLLGFDEHYAFSISLDGATAVGRAGSFASPRPVRWTSAGIEQLPGLPGGDGRGEASGVSSDGAVIGGEARAADGTLDLVRWTDAGVESLVPPAADILGAVSAARDVSGNGDVIIGVWGLLSTGRLHPVVWTEATGLQRIDSVAAAVGLNLDGWELTDVFAVSEDGLTIVGRGSSPAGRGEGWVLRLDSIPDIANVPEPSTLVLVAAGLAGCSARRRPSC
jgi:uncharacterized membrane protein